VTSLMSSRISDFFANERVSLHGDATDGKGWQSQTPEDWRQDSKSGTLTAAHRIQIYPRAGPQRLNAVHLSFRLFLEGGRL